MSFVQKLKAKWIEKVSTIHPNANVIFSEPVEVLEESISEDLPFIAPGEPLPIMDFNITSDSNVKYYRPNHSWTVRVSIGGVSPLTGSFEEQSKSEKETVERLRSFIGKSDYLIMPKSVVMEELEESYEGIFYEYDQKGFGVSFIPEPEGAIKPCEIRIEIGGFGVAGYVPSYEIEKVSDFLYGKMYKRIQIVEWHVFGGRSRYLDVNDRGNSIVVLDKRSHELTLEITFGYQD